MSSLKPATTPKITHTTTFSPYSQNLTVQISKSESEKSKQSCNISSI